MLQHGQFGLRIIDRGRVLTAKQLQTAEVVLRTAMKDVKDSRIYYRFHTNRAIGKKGNEVAASPSKKIMGN